MKEIHYQNVGYPRTGTSWLWKSLSKNEQVFRTSNLFRKITSADIKYKENPWQELNQEKLLVDPTEYINIYKHYDISLNFRPDTFSLNSDIIEKIATYTTHVSITIRNPYEMLDSFYNLNTNVVGIANMDNSLPGNMYSKIKNDWDIYKNTHPYVCGKNLDDVLDFYILYIDLPNTLRKWSLFKNKFKVFFYDDLLADYNSYYQDVCNFVEIPFNEPIKIPYNSGKKNLQDRNISEAAKFNYKETHKDLINSQIDQVSDLLGRNLNHWKR